MTPAPSTALVVTRLIGKEAVAGALPDLRVFAIGQAKAGHRFDLLLIAEDVGDECYRSVRWRECRDSWLKDFVLGLRPGGKVIWLSGEPPPLG